MSGPALELRGITKTYGPTVADRAVDLIVAAGEVHAVVGENGAGKSTLLQIAAGSIQADAGEIHVDGELLTRPTPARAIARGVGLVAQHFQLLGPFTVAENVVLGAEPRKGMRLDRARAEAEVRALAGQFGLDIDPTRRVETLSVGEQQRVEILKVLYRNARLLILDEPTAVLAPLEVDELFRVLRSLVAQGRTVVFVTHKLREVMAISDRVTVMRRGEVVATLETKSTSIAALAGLMVGGATETPAGVAGGVAGLAGAREGVTPASASVALKVEGLRVQGAQGTEAVRGVSLEVAPGEIVGIAGVQGNGQTELIEALAGLMPYHGQVSLAGTSVDGLDPGGRFQAGLAHIPEDRHLRGLVLDFSVADNLILGSQRAYARAGQLQRARILEHAGQAISSFAVNPADPLLPASALSGGNQQKVVVARELGRQPKVLLAAQPSRGVDIGAMATVHRALRTARARGTGILLVSADLSELLELSDRILVMYRGEVVGELARGEATEARLGALMVGGRGDG